MCEYFGSTLSASALYLHAVLRNRDRFHQCVFGDLSSFMGADFGPLAYLARRTFRGAAHFEATDDNPERSLLFQSVPFENCRFEGPVQFTNRVFARPTSFKDALFAVAPDFYGCQIHQSG